MVKYSEKQIMRLIIGLLFVLCLASLSFSGYTFLHREKTAYIEASVIFGKFKGKIEIEKKYKLTQDRQKAIVDSLNMDYEMYTRKYAAAKDGKEKQMLEKSLDDMRANYQRLTAQFKRYNEQESDRLNQEIWTQINQYLKDYGSREKYVYIFGAMGDGHLMYAQDSRNITEQALEYINKRYDDKK